jgi:tetratricopeptide (TPR) repeat protein
LQTQLSRNVIVIDAFAAPKSYEELGFTSQVLSKRLSDEIQSIKTEVQTAGGIYKEKELALASDEGALPDFVLPSTGLSLQTLVKLAQDILHKQPRRVDVEITFPWASNGSTHPASGATDMSYVDITIRIAQGTFRELPLKTIRTKSDPNVFVAELAEKILRHVDPYLLAAYKFDKRDDSGARAIAQEMIDSKDGDPRFKAQAYSLLGHSSLMRMDLQGAFDAYTLSKKSDPSFAPARNGLANVISRPDFNVISQPDFIGGRDRRGKLRSHRENLDLAMDEWKEAIKLDPKYTAPRVNLASAIAEKGNLSAAIELCKEAARN